ncbi:MAG TPA: NADH-quinone oxidoreductase subunit NuoE [Acidocella sp.]|jgi:NADH-quinone oxidoreductase subunit E|nr:NADH-quinone oxidoreductase subunit NuoE [Acidocella sp.]
MSTVDVPAPLSGEEREHIAAMAGHGETARSACIEALKYVQSRHGWVNDAQLAEIADLLGLSAAELDSVATFYNLIFRKPVGQHVIFLCDSVSCWIMGRERVCAQLHQRLGISQGETTKDGAYTLLPIVCLGHCDHAPAMLIDETLYGDVDAAKLDAIFPPEAHGT